MMLEIGGGWGGLNSVCQDHCGSFMWKPQGGSVASLPRLAALELGLCSLPPLLPYTASPAT